MKADCHQLMFVRLVVFQRRWWHRQRKLFCSSRMGWNPDQTGQHCLLCAEDDSSHSQHHHIWNERRGMRRDEFPTLWISSPCPPCCLKSPIQRRWWVGPSLGWEEKIRQALTVFTVGISQFLLRWSDQNFFFLNQIFIITSKITVSVTNITRVAAVFQWFPVKIDAEHQVVSGRWWSSY